MIDIEKDAKALLASAKKQREDMSKKPEAKGAGPGPSPEIKKTEDEVKKVDEKPDIEAQAKQDEAILAKKEEELNEDEKKRKIELVKIKKDAEDKDKKSNVQKRIDELTGTIKAQQSERVQDKAKIESLQAELDGIKKQLSITPQDKQKEQIKGELLKRRQKYVEEDKKLPREDRREMTKEELDEWAAEDYEAAQDWIASRAYRRAEEEKHLKVNLEQTTRAEAILDKQEVSAKRTLVKHPELNVDKRKAELIGQGKSKEEVLKTLCEENPKYKLCVDIYNENPAKYTLADNGPELVVEEMEKRLSKQKPEAKGSEVDELKKRLAEKEAEIDRLKGLDDDIGSEGQGKPITQTDENKELSSLARDVGLDPKKVMERDRRRRGEFR